MRLLPEAIASIACLYWLSLIFEQRCTNDLNFNPYLSNVVVYCDIIAI